MKIERKVTQPVFDPITITVESLEELKWMFAIANTSTNQASSQTYSLGFDLNNDCAIHQMALWNALGQYKDLVE